MVSCGVHCEPPHLSTADRPVDVGGAIGPPLKLLSRKPPHAAPELSTGPPDESSTWRFFGSGAGGGPDPLAVSITPSKDPMNYFCLVHLCFG